MALFRPAFEFLLPHEGGYSFDPSDAGGKTKFGISARSYPNINIEELTIAEAEAIYRRDFWEPNRYGAFDSQEIASKAFDLAVNMGAGTANRLLQGACILCGAHLSADGKVGPETIQAVNSAPPDKLLRNLIALAVGRYKQIAIDHPQDAKFLGGWIKRAASVPLEGKVNE
jgi:lysozyme family protein